MPGRQKMGIIIENEMSEQLNRVDKNVFQKYQKVDILR